jgi:carbon-monoxide dehydrogenase medium subunit
LKPAPFAYHCPESLEEALALLAEHGDESKVLAGGQSLVPMMAFRLARPSVLVDLNQLPGLSEITVSGDTVVVGSMVRERAAERSAAMKERVPLLAEALPLIGHEAIRTRGTIGGSLSHADPAAELPAVALATGATLVLSSAARGERSVEAADFFEGYFTTALEPDEILTEIRFPSSPEGTGVCIEEAARRHGDFAMVGVAASLRLDGSTIADARLALIGVSDVPVRAREAEQALIGQAAGAAAYGEAAALAVRDLTPSTDLHGSAAYRVSVAGTLVGRALEGAAVRSRASRGEGGAR